MTWTRRWDSRDKETTVEVILDGESGVRYIYDNTSVFPKWQSVYYDSALETLYEMERWHEDPEFEEV